MPNSTNDRSDLPRIRSGQTSQPLDPGTNDQDPLPHQLATVREEQLRGIRLLYPGLQEIRDQDLREAVYAHRQQLARHVPRAHYDRLPAHSRRRPDQGEILRYRAAHPETRWMSSSGVAAALVFEQERGRWLREGFLADQGSETHSSARAADGLGIHVPHPPRTTARASVHTSKGRSLEPTDTEVEELRAQCAATAALSPNHIRSIIIYLRQRRGRRRAKQHAPIYNFIDHEDTALSVPENSIRRRIKELQTAGSPSIIQRANTHRIQELQRLVADERARRLRHGERLTGYVVDRAVQTIESARVQDLLPAQGDLGPGEEIQADDEDGESDGGMTLDEEDGDGNGDGDDGSPRSRNSLDDDDDDDDDEYHDLFEELHGELL